MNIQETDKIVEEISIFLKQINRWATILQFLTVLFAVTIVVTSLMISFLIGEKNNTLIKVMAFLTSFCSISMSTLGLEKKARDMREGYRYLKYATFKYRTGEYDINDLVTAYNDTEKIIGHINIEEKFAKLIEVKRAK